MTNRVAIFIVLATLFLFAAGDAISEQTVRSVKSENEQLASGEMKSATITGIDAGPEDDVAALHFKRAEELIREGKNDAALEELNRAISLKPNRAKYYQLRGDHYRSKAIVAGIMSKNMSKKINYRLKALNNYNKCIELSGNEHDLKKTCEMLKAESMCDMGRHGEGIDTLSKIIAKSKSDANDMVVLYYKLLATCHEKANQFDKAISDLSRALNFAGDSELLTKTLLSSRAQLYRSNKQLSDALADFKAACGTCRNETKCFEGDCMFAYDVEREIKRGTKWVLITSASDANWYYDKTSVIRKSNHDVKVWLRMEPVYLFDDKGSFLGGDDFSYKLQLWHIDCANREIGYESHIEYDSNGNATGHHDYSPNETRQSVIPETVGEKIYDRICKQHAKDKLKKKPENTADKDT